MNESVISVEVNKEGTKFYRNEKGQLHRNNGPAIEWTDGTKEWYKINLRHRINGPAIEYSNGKKEYFIVGIQYTEKEYMNEIKQFI